jgi:hypothetical protein
MNALPSSSEFHAEATASPMAFQARIELLREDILDAIGMMQAALDAAKAMAEIPSDAGLLHGLRVAKAHSRALWGHAADLGSAHAELASALRQADAP